MPVAALMTFIAFGCPVIRHLDRFARGRSAGGAGVLLHVQTRQTPREGPATRLSDGKFSIGSHGLCGLF